MVSCPGGGGVGLGAATLAKTRRPRPRSWTRFVRDDVADVLLVDVPKQAGAFRNLCERLAAEHLNIDYAYSSSAGQSGSQGGGLAVVKVNNPAKAQKVLGENNNARRKKAQPGRRPAHAR